MRVAYSFDSFVRYYGLTIQRVQKVVQVGPVTDDGLSRPDGASVHANSNSRGSAREDATFAMPSSASENIFSKMAVIVPTKNEPVDKLLAVISAIPEHILPIVVSNSSRTPGEDKYKEEVDGLRAHCLQAGNRVALAIHQKDPGAGKAFEAVEAPESTNLTDGDHKLRNGKGEGMLLGVALAAMCPERQYVGFVDSDNFVPSSAAEYCYAFALGFYMHLQNVYTMVRIKWASKPKAVRNRLDYPAEGRSSRIVNKWFNRMLSLLPNAWSPSSSIGSVMQTGNAGEHAMTMKLALKLKWAGGYAVEPFQIVHMLSMAAAGVFGLANGNSHRHTHEPELFAANIVQIHSLNPHIHSPGDDEHIRGMIREGLGCMYHRVPSISPPSTHSRATNGHNSEWGNQFRNEILSSLEPENLGRTAPPAPRVYRSLDSLDLGKLHSIMLQSCETLEVMGPYRLGPSRVQNGRA